MYSKIILQTTSIFYLFVYLTRIKSCFLCWDLLQFASVNGLVGLWCRTWSTPSCRLCSLTGNELATNYYAIREVDDIMTRKLLHFGFMHCMHRDVHWKADVVCRMILPRPTGDDWRDGITNGRTQLASFCFSCIATTPCLRKNCKILSELRQFSINFNYFWLVGESSLSCPGWVRCPPPIKRIVGCRFVF